MVIVVVVIQIEFTHFVQWFVWAEGKKNKAKKSVVKQGKEKSIE